MATVASNAIALAVCDVNTVTARIPCILLRIFIYGILSNAPFEGYSAVRKSAHKPQLLPRCRFALLQRLVGILHRKHQIHNLS